MNIRIPLLALGLAGMYACSKETRDKNLLNAPISLASMKNQEFVNLLDREKTADAFARMVKSRFDAIKPATEIAAKKSKTESAGKTASNLYDETNIPSASVVVPGLPVGGGLPQEQPSITRDYQWTVCSNIFNWWEVIAEGTAYISNRPADDTTSYFLLQQLAGKGSRITGVTGGVGWSQTYEATGISSQRLNGWHEIRGALSNVVYTMSVNNVCFVRVPYKNN